MKKITELIEEKLAKAFEQGGYDSRYAAVSLSNRPDLCEYQCNGALAAAKEYKKAPIAIANEVLALLANNDMFELAEAVMPGFINLKLAGDFLAGYVNQMIEEERFGLEVSDKPDTIVVDYGGPNVAKPLHIGHLRSAIIGESIKRILRYCGHNVIGDAHLGDWGLQMGLIITELKLRRPELVFFDENYAGEYPKEAPFTITELEEIYPVASAKSKEDEEYKKQALLATADLQKGNRGYRAIWEHILNISICDLKKNYEKLNVNFDLWKKESDAQPYIPDMVEKMKKDGFAYVSDGALVVDVSEETDAKEIPPCIILKSDGSSLYATTDLATIIERKELFHPQRIIYLTDKRQELHFKQVFRCIRKTGFLEDSVELKYIGFGTMNGSDGKPFKTRDGGVMRLENLIGDVRDEMYKKIIENKNNVSKEEAKQTSEIVALAAIKYGDLSNQPSKDYVFDIDRFTSFEGNTGPYILYTIVRIKSILNKCRELGIHPETDCLLAPVGESEKKLMLTISNFITAMQESSADYAPQRICAFIYELANDFNHFYHETKIIGEENQARQASWIRLLSLSRDILENCIDLLGFSAPERM